MTKKELEAKIAIGVPLGKCFDFTEGQECEIFKADQFEATDEIIYIPDLDLNDLRRYAESVNEYESAEIAREVLGCCYTGNDFIWICNGDRPKAEELFHYCDWQHPSSALPELLDDEEDEQDSSMKMDDSRKVAVRTSGGGYLTKDGEVAVFENEKDASDYARRVRKSGARVKCRGFLYSIGRCKKCGSPLFQTDLEQRGYVSQCFTCDEDFYGFEQETE